MLEDERHFRPKSRRKIYMTLYCIRPVFVDILRAERCVCFWPSWFSRPNS